jgi:hypothetical protein
MIIMNFLFKCIYIICLFSLFLPYGCIPLNMTQNDKQQPNRQSHSSPTKEQSKNMKSIKQIYYVHIVRWEGESLSAISRWYIGNYKYWRLLAKHNPELDPYNIHIGDRVWIPKDKMKVFRQMPEEFINKNKKKIRKKPLELYGHKDHKEKAKD